MHTEKLQAAPPLTTQYLAAGPDLTRELTDVEFKTLNQLGLIAPCYECTRRLNEGTEDEVVYHPPTEAAEAEIRAALSPKKH